MSLMNMNAEQFQKNIQGDQPVLVEFMAPWCVYCRRIAPALEKISGQYGGSLIFGQVNIDSDPRLAEQEKIEVVPTFVLYQNGQALGSMTAPDSKAKIEEFLRQNLNM